MSLLNNSTSLAIPTTKYVIIPVLSAKYHKEMLAH
jgi:hypothetical protein